MEEDKWNWKRKKEFCIPIRQVCWSEEIIEATNLAEAIEIFEESEKDYEQFDGTSPSIQLDEEDEIIKEYREDLKNRGVLPI